jgi:hypothetical protein
MQGPGGGESLNSDDETVADFARDARHDLDAVAVVMHTSGTSSRSMPVELTYGNHRQKPSKNVPLPVRVSGTAVGVC